MNTDTGQIKNYEEMKKLMQCYPEEKPNWFLIDFVPDKNCKACEGNGFVGYFPNSKVIPCRCIFDTHNSWSMAIVKQRDLPKASKDHGCSSIKAKRG